ncbi:hypothetical protein TWF694_009855 [Orbilia ellipsospora]|uniref:Kelch repeat protein n=1 Tax=Orbilia ellipsospora TaxID=2528407 RepID=A0AAV9XC30_9PEZI
MSSLSTGANPVRDTCSLTGHGALAVGDLLYFQGGRMIYNWQIGWGGYGQNPYLRVLNFTNSVNQQNVADSIITVQSDTAPFNYDGETIQDTRLPLFWLDEAGDKAYLAGGAMVNIANTSYIGGRDWNPGKPGKMWTADVQRGNILNNWEEVDMLIGGKKANLIGSGANWFDSESRVGYAFGGSYLDGAEYDYAVNQLLMFNVTSGQWKNTTTPFDQSAAGFLHGLTLEGRTVLIAGLGSTNGQEGAVNTIRVYDTESDQWYTQLTNGDLPANRFWSGCSVIVAAQDKSSYQIITYGGADNSVTYGDVWALSIPSFTWTQLSDDVSSTVAAGPRYASSCTLMKNHTIVVIGGNKVIDADTYNFPNCDLNSDLAYFFDLNIQGWTSQISSGAQDEYRVPSPVYEAIGGNAQGGATLTQPPGGFNQAGMSTVFAAFATAPPSTTSGSPGTTTSTGGPSNTSTPSKSSNTGLIAGVVVGVVALIGIIAFGVWFFIIRRRRREEATPTPPPPPDQDKYPTELGGAGYDHAMELHGNQPSLELYGSSPHSPSPIAPTHGLHEVPA